MGVWLGVAVVIAVAIGVFLFARRGTPVAAPGDAAGTVAVQPEVTTQAIPRVHIYSDTADPEADIAAALKQAKSEHKRVLLDFGGNWCGDCQVLDLYFHQAPNSEMLARNFVVVHVSVGPTGIEKNFDLGAKYEVPLKKGVPALAVLDETGKLVYAQRTGEFENMRHMDVGSVTEFLNRWKG